MQPATRAAVEHKFDSGASRALAAPSLRTVYGLALEMGLRHPQTSSQKEPMGPSLTNALTVTTAMGSRMSLATPCRVRVPFAALSQAMDALRQNGSAVIGVQRHSQLQLASGASHEPEQPCEAVTQTEAKPRRRNRKKQG